ncbi:hypothetical protein HHK36_024661 [Tetracentron sinense]|uniref:Dof-type domain-containing protein n=1 Tax=Tetracentron sinense TaxID=13715 RepID=A0A835D7P6_TETSI|nr:hypothetical protein HHK36_024661 [Tetracentron sinense]
MNNMPGTKDPEIKLFGKTIHYSSGVSSVLGDTLRHDPPSSSSTPSSLDKKSNRVAEEEEEVDPLGGKLSENEQEDGTPHPTSEELADLATSSRICKNPQTPSVDKEPATLETSKTEEEKNETGISQEKTLKKPDKILPCPRCNSMDTKFCYYNNYNVSQPRHFCKNCQRYWTAGGTMRNVPVGSGRRKNKSSPSHYRHITVSEVLRTSQTYDSNGIHHPTLKTNGSVLTFGSDIPLCESMASALNMAEQKALNCDGNGFHRPEEQRIPVSCTGEQNGYDHLSVPSVTASNLTGQGGRIGLQEPVMRNCHGFPPQIPYFWEAPWSYPWNSAQWSSAVPPPAFCPSNFPISFYPMATNWGCIAPGAWNIPWLSPPSSSPNHRTLSSSPNSATLGKNSRDENILTQSNVEKEEPLSQKNSERCLWIPKTLRIDDPSEAAKSSIWETLGIKKDKCKSISGGGLFQAFQSKGDQKNQIAEISPVMQANPAALSRSLNFQENA